MQKRHEYIVNVWMNALNDGTATFWRGTDEEEFYKQGAKALKLYGFRPRRCRMVNGSERTYFSISLDEAYDAWGTFPVFAPCEIGAPKRFLDELDKLKAEERNAERRNQGEAV